MCPIYDASCNQLIFVGGWTESNIATTKHKPGSRTRALLEDCRPKALSSRPVVNTLNTSGHVPDTLNSLQTLYRTGKMAFCIEVKFVKGRKLLDCSRIIVLRVLLGRASAWILLSARLLTALRADILRNFTLRIY